MIPLDRPLDYVWMIVVAAVLGAIGGIGFEFGRARSGETSSLVAPAWWPNWKYLDFGFFASVLLGAMAAVVALYFFAPEMPVKAEVGGEEVIKTRWQITKLVPLSLIIGFSGRAFLDAAQARVIARLQEEAKTRTQDVGTRVAEQVGEAGRSAAAQATTEFAKRLQPAVSEAVHAASAERPAEADPEKHLSKVQDTIDTAISQAVRDVDASLTKQVEAAQQVIAAASGVEAGSTGTGEGGESSGS